MERVRTVTTYVPFTPSTTLLPPFQTTLTLDGTAYTFSAWWNLLGRWYFTLTDTSQNPIYTGAMVGSPDDASVFLAPGVFQASTLLFRSSTRNIETNP